MHEALAELAAGAIRPVLAQAVARLERVAVLMAILVGCGLLAVAAMIGFIAAGAVALAPAVGTAGAIGIGAGALLVLSIAGVLITRRSLVARGGAAHRSGEPAAETAKTGVAKAGAAQPPAPAEATKTPLVDPTFAVAVCATATILLGPSGMMRAVRGTLDAIRLAASLLAGAELLKSLDQMTGVFRGEGPTNAGSTAAGSAASGATPAQASGT